MKELTNDQRDRLRYAVYELSKIELRKPHLTDDQLLLLFHVLAYDSKTTYYLNGKDMKPWLEKNSPEPGTYLGYGGAGWFVEDHF